MPNQVSERIDVKETVSYSIPASVVRAIEYRAYLDRTNKSEAATRLIREGAASLNQRTPNDGEAA